MGKATKRVSGRYYITKKITAHIGAREVFQYVLSVAAYEDNMPRKSVEEQAACDVINGYFYEPEADKHSAEENKRQYLDHLEKSLAFCIKKFSDIPSDEFKKEYYYYKGFLD